MLEIQEHFLYGTAISVETRRRMDEGPFEASYNIKPTQHVPALYIEDGEIQLCSARWWFVPHWHKGPAKDWKATTFNAKLEDAANKPSFRTAWKTSRCIIPATGYYEWTGEKGQKQPHFIRVQSNLPCMMFAGLRSTLQDGTDTCTIMTRAVDKAIGHIHHRMPVILSPDEVKAWLTYSNETKTDIAQLGTAWAGRFQSHEVERFGRDDDAPELIEPIRKLF